MAAKQAPGEFKIGAVTRITGIPAETLRMWERRYGVVRPARGKSQSRLYSEQDVKHLTMLKHLVSRGHAIGTLVDLTEQELQERLLAHTTMQQPATVSGAAEQPVKVCALGPTLPITLPALVREAGSLDLVGLYNKGHEFEEGVPLARPEVLVLEYGSLQQSAIGEIMERFRVSGAQRLVVVYRFANGATLDRLAADNIETTRAPLSASTLEALCARRRNVPEVALPAPAGPTPRRFSDAQISKIATINTEVGCECPHHVAEILAKLNAFETYSQECEDLNEEDAALHAHLWRITMQARATFEAALPRILEADGIDLAQL